MEIKSARKILWQHRWTLGPVSGKHPSEVNSGPFISVVVITSHQRFSNFCSTPATQKHETINSNKKKSNLNFSEINVTTTTPNSCLLLYFQKKIILIHGGLTPCFPPGHNHLWICAPQFENHLYCSSILCGQKSCSCGSEMRSAFCAPWKPSLKWTSYAFTYFLSYTNTKHMKHGHTFK